MSAPTQFYTYSYLRYDGTPMYVGKGSGERAFKQPYHRVKPPKDRRFIIVQYHESEADAFAAEMFLIAYYGRKDLGTGCLRNMTDGGDGAANPSAETRAKLRAARLGKPLSDAHKHSLSKAHLGRKQTAAAIFNRAQANLGKHSFLSNKQVAEIKARLSFTKGRALAKEFNVSDECISGIKCGRRWQHVAAAGSSL